MVGDKLTFTITGKTAAGATFTQADIDKAIADASADAPDKAKNIKVKLDGDIETTDVTALRLKMLLIKQKLPNQQRLLLKMQQRRLL